MTEVLEPVFYTIDQAVELLQLSRTTITRRIGDGTIPARKIGRRILIQRAWVERFASTDPVEVAS